MQNVHRHTFLLFFTTLSNILFIDVLTYDNVYEGILAIVLIHSIKQLEVLCESAKQSSFYRYNRLELYKKSLFYFR